MYTERAVRRTYGARNERAARTMATFIISLCAILMLTTVSGLICRKAQLPEVIGQILVGILVGPSLLGVMHMSDSLSLFSDLGIIILMFLGGVGCNLQLLKKYSKAAVIIACMGVVFPVAVMGGVSLLFGFKPIPAAFIGVVFSATSVSISVAVLKEAGLLDSKEGVSILGAAVADDVIGVILLSVMCTLVNTGSVDVAGLGLILLKQGAVLCGGRRGGGLGGAGADDAGWRAEGAVRHRGDGRDHLPGDGVGVESGRVELRGGRVFRRHRGKQQRLRGGRGPVYRAGWRHVVRAGVLRGHRPADHRRG